MKTLIMHDRLKHDFYRGEDGSIMRRETGEMPNGVYVHKYWVLRDNKENYIDHDKYRNRLAERNKIELKHDYEI